jgi:hypothetical protein
MAAQLVEKFPIFCGIKGLLPCSQEPTTEPCPEPDESNQHQILVL